MRAQILLPALGVIALCGCAERGAAARAPSAAAATGGPAVAIVPETGYSAEDRHAADCLAVHPSYDVRTDRFQARSGARRRCAIPEH